MKKLYSLLPYNSSVVFKTTKRPLGVMRSNWKQIMGNDKKLYYFHVWPSNLLNVWMKTTNFHLNNINGCVEGCEYLHDCAYVDMLSFVSSVDILYTTYTTQNKSQEIIWKMVPHTELFKCLSQFFKAYQFFSQR